MSDERLGRMEDKLDKLSEAVVEMARMEERLLTVFKRLEHMDAAFKKYDDHVDEIEKQINLLFTIPILFSRTFAPLMAEQKKGTIVNVSSLATLYPLPFMPLYNAGKSALSSFSQSMILEYQNRPKFIDFRLGDISSEFNNAQNKQSENNWSERMKSAWHQIEMQLLESPKPEIAALQLQKMIAKEKSGVFYGGGFFQSKVASKLRIFLNHRGLLFLLRNRYFT